MLLFSLLLHYTYCSVAALVASNPSKYFRPAESILTTSTILPNTVDLGYTRYQGGENVAAGVKYWLGVRFAAAPLGDLRWRAPRDPVVNSSIQDARNFQAVCIGTGKFRDARQDEDCLFLNIFAPANTTSESRLPVWFFIPGGGYSLNSDANYNATHLIKQSGGNIIVVQTSYRVSAFGFLSSEKIRENGDLNVGFLDQRKALEWVQKYIRKFGGDPDHVVIHGDSAGAGSAVLHLLAYNGRDDGLFRAAILESVFFPTQRTVNDYEYQYNNFVSLSNCTNAQDTLACLRDSKLSLLMNANSHPAPYPNANNPPFFPYAPCVDGKIFSNYPAQLIIDGKFLGVPIMIGDDTDEGNGFVMNASTPAEVAAFMHDQYPKLTTYQLEIINKLYPKLPALPRHAPYFPSLALAYGEATFTCPGLLISSVFHSFSLPVYNYRYNVQDDFYLSAGRGVPHVFELEALFKTYDSTSSYNTYNAPIVSEVQDYWINFVRWSNPTPSRDNSSDSYTRVKWDTWGTKTGGLKKAQRLLIQTNITQMEEVPDEQLLRCQFWEDVIYQTEI